ncbi:MAG: SDR family NAD(P)-dependent oxidoreductase [Muribaculaceae bacterium]|nr:SDR family NAD(P)-dependent oxidoreductase [Muribaculaceae bacterium]MBQ2562782.1 SDR family NAD(P)-dependent oxidoreductase [Muribaculaceae bacterium]MDY6293725.1 SDR family NAD(P)-dependent oxidoreductase [Bacteroidales bacterium]MDY6411497.1 SDR family NAD(P)-dependent oxidoreductase [Bacteroidales bacterium]
MDDNNTSLNQNTAASEVKPLYIITGATGAMGKVIAKRIAAQGKPLILACRELDKGEKLASELKEKTLNADIHAMHLDLSSFARVKAFVTELTELHRPVAALINNSAVLPRRRKTSVDGFEYTIQVNFLSTVLLSMMVVPLFSENGGRIVMTTSLMRNFTSLPYEFPAVNNFVPLTTFAQSKLALTLFSIYMSTTLRTRHVTVNCADPGIINAGMLTISHWIDTIRDHVGQTLIHNPEDGAIAVMRALESSDTGFIFKGLDRQVKTSSLLKNREVFIKLCNDTMRIIKSQMP